EALLLQLARECGVVAYRTAMFEGRPINNTEQRAVMHWLLRKPAPGKAGQAQAAIDTVAPEIASALHDVHATLEDMLALAERVRGDDGITDIVNIGIGGSDLGPAMVVKALDDLRHPGKRLHFISNVDGMELGSLLRQLRPESTLFLIASKTFTTAETMSNAQAARAWFLDQGGSEDARARLPLARHFYALTTNLEAAAQFGITTTLGFWDWVGGRYSLWSVIGLPIAIAVGAVNFRALLAGAHAMDQHFASTPLERNVPVLLALVDIWYRNFHGFTSRSVAPYHQGLRRLPAYLQQLEMESNGKGVDRDGQALSYDTSPVVWGEAGSNGQHAYFQMLHQGTDVIPVEFIAVRTPNFGVDGELAERLNDQHRKLLANCLAQSQALMQGKSFEAALAESAPTASKSLDAATIARHRSFPGNRPSTTLVLEALTPASLGALIALYEHRVFVSGALWGINSFDQWGVELGKALCASLLPRVESGDVSGLDASTAGLLQRLR
ncbi:MAG TPA: glucose-6-phosphate isomerase, partial [Burkholderiaceae bacterium]